MEPHPPSPNLAITLNVAWCALFHRLVSLVLPRSDDILSSPVKLGELLTICAELAEIEPRIREAATTLAMQKKEIFGWTLIHRDGHRYVEASRVVELCLQCPAGKVAPLLAELARQLGNISEAKYQALCEGAGLLPQADAVKQSGATVFLRRNPTTTNQNV